MERYVIVVAGGKGLRMGGDIPKQFLPIGGKPVLMRTIEVFLQVYPDIRIILVIYIRKITLCFFKILLIKFINCKPKPGFGLSIS